MGVIKRLLDVEICRKITGNHPRYFTFDIEDWFSNPLNYALIHDENIAFAEWKSEGVYHVHFCFDTARGRDAIRLTKQMFEEFCRSCPVEIAIGLISDSNKKAKWVIRQVGFKSLGEIETENGICEMFYATREMKNGSV